MILISLLIEEMSCIVGQTCDNISGNQWLEAVLYCVASHLTTGSHLSYNSAIVKPLNAVSVYRLPRFCQPLITKET